MRKKQIYPIAAIVWGFQTRRAASTTDADRISRIPVMLDPWDAVAKSGFQGAEILSLLNLVVLQERKARCTR